MMDITLLLFLAVIVIVGLILVVIMGTRPRRAGVLDRAQYQKDWDEIVASVTSDASTQQFAILQADKLLDRALKEKGFQGNTMAERLTSASRVFSRRDAVWTAHKLRNRIAHDHNITITLPWTKKALNSFKRALKDVGAL